MPTPSNLYAEKIFAEHPIALWALDDKSDYLSLISEESREFFNPLTWSISSAASAVQESVLAEPFVESATTRITSDDSVTSVTLTSSDITSFSDLDGELKTFAIGLYLYDITGSVSSISIGYEYGSGPTQVLKEFSTSVPNKWVFLSETFSFFDLLSSTEQLRLVIKVNYELLPATTEYEFLLNGLTFGQWSENFNTSSLGISVQDLPSTIALPSLKAVEAKAYGLQDLSGYYISNGTRVFAKNAGVPLVYGASNTTTIYPIDNTPSVIVPGCGFLNESGQYKAYSVELWLRVNSNSSGKKRIFGPIASNDGLYVDGPFITLKIGQKESSYFIGEWFRPMLVHIRVTRDSASLLINGDEVLATNLNDTDLNFPAEKDQNGKSQDWLGFYAHNDVFPIDLDCVAIYPYAVPAVVAKRRWVYGQGVEFPEKVNTAYKGTSVFVDYSFANYANNYSYPNIGNWNQGTANNVLLENRTLSTPEYEAPEVFVDLFQIPIIGPDFSTPIESLYEDMASIQNESEIFINLKPTEDWQDAENYLEFSRLNFLQEDVKAFFGIFKYTTLPSGQEAILKISDASSDKHLTVYANSGSLVYKFKSGSSAEEIIHTENSAYTNNNKFFVGFNIDSFVSSFGNNLALFWGNRDRLSVSVGPGFSGNIYRFDFCNAKSLYNSSSIFDSFGLAISDSSYDYQDSFSSYSLIPKLKNNTMYLDVGVGSSWQDYLPLTYFAKNVLDVRGDQYYDLDFIQFNVNYPKIQQFIIDEESTYYDTGNSPVKFYISFQTLQSGSNTPLESFVNTKLLPKDGVIRPGSEWVNTKYEILDDSLIYMPNNISFNDIGIVTHIQINSSENLSKRVILKSLEYASQSFSETTPTAVGTRFGKKIYPYRQSGIYYSYKDINPFTIYKGNTPYLYLTKKTGIKLSGEITSSVNRGLSVPINENLVEDSKIIALQLSLLYDQEFFPDTPTKIFEVEARDSYLKFYVVSSQPDGARGRIYAVNSSTGEENKDVVYFVNGNLSYSPTINLTEWLMLGITFPNPLIFRNYLGAIRINGPALVNNISYYESTNLQEVQLTVNRPWSRVLAKTEEEDYIWNFWNENFIWGDVLVVSTSSSFGVDASNIYKSYTGTNKIIIDDTKVDTDTTNTLVFQEYEYNILQNVLLESRTINAV